MNKPWQELDVTKEKLDELWGILQFLKENASEIEYPMLFLIDLRYDKFYKDQQEHWNENDAKMLYYSLYRDLVHNNFIEEEE